MGRTFETVEDITIDEETGLAVKVVTRQELDQAPESHLVAVDDPKTVANAALPGIIEAALAPSPTEAEEL